MTRLASRSFRSTLPVVFLGAALLAGCSKKTTAPNSQPKPEGQQDGQVLLMAWHEQQSLSFVLDDPGTPDNTLDDRLSSVFRDFWADSAGVRTATIDVSNANQMQAYRVGDDGNAHPLFDFLLQPDVRFVGSDLDLFGFEDFQAPSATPRYFERGAVNGQVTTSSPLSNAATSGPFLENMAWLPPSKLAPNDSTLKIAYSEDPRAVFDVVQIGEASSLLGTGSSFTGERRARGIASPVLPGLRSIAMSATTVLPAGTGRIAIPLTSHKWPQFFYIRVTGFDANGHMVNRVNTYLRTQTAESGHNLFTYEPLGGAVQVIDPYPDFNHPVAVPQMFSNDFTKQTFQAFGGNPGTGTVSFLSVSSAITAPPASLSNELANQIQANPNFAPRRLRDRMVAISRAMAAPSPSLRTALARPQ